MTSPARLGLMINFSLLISTFWKKNNNLGFQALYFLVKWFSDYLPKPSISVLNEKIKTYFLLHVFLTLTSKNISELCSLVTSIIWCRQLIVVGLSHLFISLFNFEKSSWNIRSPAQNHGVFHSLWMGRLFIQQADTTISFVNATMYKTAD
jgi:hypothetical protein